MFYRQFEAYNSTENVNFFYLMPISPKSLESIYSGDSLVWQLVVQLGSDQGGGFRWDLDGGHDEDRSRRTQNVPIRLPKIVNGGRRIQQIFS